MCAQKRTTKEVRQIWHSSWQLRRNCTYPSPPSPPRQNHRRKEYIQWCRHIRYIFHKIGQKTFFKYVNRVYGCFLHPRLIHPTFVHCWMNHPPGLSTPQIVTCGQTVWPPTVWQYDHQGTELNTRPPNQKASVLATEPCAHTDPCWSCYPYGGLG